MAAPTDNAEGAQTPHHTVLVGGRGGTIPPIAHRFKKGNKLGSRANLPEANITLYMKAMSRRLMSTKALRRVLESESRPHLMRTAAERLLKSCAGATTLADFDPWISGAMTLTQLKEAGVRVELLKCATITKEGRRIELLDSARDEANYVENRLTGLPDRTVNINANINLRTPADREAEATSIAQRFRHLFDASPG